MWQLHCARILEAERNSPSVARISSRGGCVVYFIVRLSRLYYIGQSQGWVSDQVRDRILHVGGP